MAAARLAALLLLGVAANLTAQSTSASQIVITVVDPTGTVIPGAYVRIIPLPVVIPDDGDWRHYAFRAPEQASAETSPSGEATFGLAKGNYALTIAAPGFQRYVEKVVIRDEPSQSLRPLLLVSPRGSSASVFNCMSCVEISPELPSLDIFIPLEPLQTIALTPRRVRRQ